MVVVQPVDTAPSGVWHANLMNLSAAVDQDERKKIPDVNEAEPVIKKQETLSSLV